MDEHRKDPPEDAAETKGGREHDPIQAAFEEVGRSGVTREDRGSFLGEQPGDVLGGRYKLLQEVGEGGFGTVWMAEQLEPLTRKVALKLLRHGLESKEVLARFESERQALAMMDHPRIAKVFDAGATETGRPFFVMEYVPGIPITDYCDVRGLDLRARLELFEQACEAVEHAHRKGVIHRDLKPSNLLVAAVDGKPSLKVIDFGVAKATSQRLTERTLFTRHGTLVGTPGYMSPEQAGSTPLEVDARTDVYSLGVLLYELLVGALPFDPKMLREVALVELLRVVREEEPPTPCARVASLGAEAEEVARRRHLDVRTLSRQLSGELEWITMRAIEKDPGRRYPSASDFALDIGRYLANEPVAAGPPSLSYRLGKYAQRHKVGISVTAAFAALSLGFGSVLAVQSSQFDRKLEESARTANERGSGAPSRRLILDPAGSFNGTVPVSDGLHLLRYDTEDSGYELVDIESREAVALTSEGPDPEQTLFVSHALSPDSRWVAGVLWVGAEPDRSPSRDNDGGRELRAFEVGGRGEGRRLHDWGPEHHVQVFGWSPDQRLVWLFVMRPDRAAEIASVEVSTGSFEVVRTLARRSHTQGPSLSPDGRFIAFHDADEGEGPDLFLLATDGSGEVRVEHPASDSKPLFTPDGAGVVFVSDRRPGFRDLWFQAIVDGRPDGDPRIVMDDLGLFGVAMQFGENGSLFYFFATNAWEVRTVELDPTGRIVGATEPLETVATEMNTTPAFSPDGRYLAHLRGGRRLVVHELDGGREREFPIPEMGTAGTSMEWGEDGSSVVVTGLQDGWTTLRVDLEHGGAERLPMEETVWLVRDLGEGEQLLARSIEQGKLDLNQVVRRSSATGEETILYEGPVDLLRCSADGTRFSFVEKAETEGRLRVMPADGGDPLTLATSPIHDWTRWRWTEFQGAMWTPDGQALLVVRGARGEEADPTLWRHPIDGGEATELGSLSLPESETAYLGTFNHSLHPDGTRIAFDYHAGFVAQMWAIDGLLPFIQSGESPGLLASRRWPPPPR
jgi:serine/threonine protein kinase/Tol biopolymer transport system component